VRLARVAPYTAVEPDGTSFQTARGRLGKRVIHGDHTALAAGGFDLVCAFEVLEHIEDDATAAAQWLALARPGGHLLVSVPAGPHRFGPSDVLVGHYRRYTADGLRDRLAEAGGVDVSVRHYGWPLGYALDSVRDRMAARRVGAAAPTAGERTHTSGRVFQPRQRVTGGLIRAAVAPFALLQRARPDHGPGLIALARRSAD
jgi:SAM-dependent methyltransferase